MPIRLPIRRRLPTSPSKRFGTLDAVGLALLLAAAAAAQVTSGSLEGIVLDDAGNPIISASIRLTHGTQAVQREVRSLDRGLFRFEQLPIGTYLLECTKDGYSPASAEVRVSVGETASVTATLQRAVKFASTTVAARKADLRVATVELAGAEISSLFEGSRIVQLPLTRRDPAELLQTLGGVPVSAQNLYGTYTVGGLRPRDTSYNVDGSSNDYGIQSGPRTPVIPEAVDEFRVVSNVYSAQFGKGPGAVLDLVIKSGGNQPHGSLFAFHVNDALDAAPFFANASATPRPPLHDTVAGATLGGPIRRDRLFFFVAFQDNAVRTRAFQSILVPADSQRAPDATSPAFPAAQPAVASLISRVLARLPRCSSISTGCVYSSAERAPSDEPAGNLKLDARITDRDIVSGRFLVRDIQGQQTSPISGMNSDLETRDFNLAGTYRKVFSPRNLNEATLAVSHFRRAINVPDTGLPDVLILGFAQIGPSFELPLTLSNNYVQVLDNFVAFRGAHTLRFGGDFLRMASGGQSRILGRGLYVFAPLPSVLGQPTSLGNFRAGISAQFQQFQGNFERAFSNWDENLYVQDDWKVRANLVLNLGLRWETQRPPSVSAPGTSTPVYAAFDPVAGRFTDWHSRKANFGPSLGFAWDPSRRGIFSVRAGYRMSYDRLVLDNYVVGSILQPPLVSALVAQIPQVFSIPFGSGPSVALTTGVPIQTMMKPDATLGRIHAWHLTLQHAVGNTAVFEAGYRGTAGRDLTIPEVLNRVNPATGKRADSRFGPVTLVDSAGYSNYHALVTGVRFRTRSTVGGTLFYTWSKALDVVQDAIAAWGGEAASASVAADPASGRPYLPLEYGPAVFDRRHMLSATFSATTPRLASGGVPAALLSSWNFGLLAFVESGNPFTVLSGADLNQDGLINDRPDLVNGSLLGNRTFGNPNAAIPRAAFSNTPGAPRIGNFGRNVLRRGGVREANIRLAKSFRLWEHADFLVTADAYNVFNTPRFGVPINDMSSPAFGQIQTQENRARTIRLGARVTF